MLVQRPEGSRSKSTTTLRKVPTKTRKGDVWEGGKTQLRDGDKVCLLRHHLNEEGHFGWVRTQSEAEGAAPYRGLR